MDQTQIQQEAKQIMDSFMEVIKEFDVEDDFTLTREVCTRVEGEGKVADEEFKRYFLKNAPKTNGDAIVANKAAWEE